MGWVGEQAEDEAELRLGALGGSWRFQVFAKNRGGNSSLKLVTFWRDEGSAWLTTVTNGTRNEGKFKRAIHEDFLLFVWLQTSDRSKEQIYRAQPIRQSFLSTIANSRRKPGISSDGSRQYLGMVTNFQGKSFNMLWAQWWGMKIVKVCEKM